MARRRNRVPQGRFQAHVEDLTHEGRGVARMDGKTVFIDGALAGEDVLFEYTRTRRSYDEGRVAEVNAASRDRVAPRCAHFGVCGGCSLQHLDSAAQLRVKQQVLLDNLQRIGHVQPGEVFEPLRGPVWGYRRKARLGVRFVPKKERVLVGFRERGKPYVADLARCEVLDARVGARLQDLAVLIQGLSCYDRIAQIEVAAGDAAVALVLRNLAPLTEADRERLVHFAQDSGLHVWLQPGAEDTAHPLWPLDSALSYRLAEHQVELAFLPTDFTQVNADINRAMVERALALLEPVAADRVLELFSGLGNFTLPLARHVGEVVAVEGEAGLVERARQNARRNGIDNVHHYVANLAQDVGGAPWLRGQHYDKVLLDPPRTGAAEMLAHIAASGARRIVYVACGPATLARDAGELVHRHGYRLAGAGVMDMFPHTAHVESIALFVRPS